MEFSRLSRWLLTVAIFSLGGCSAFSAGGAVESDQGIAAKNDLITELSDLQGRLAAESARAATAEQLAQRAEAEAEWLAKAAKDAPQLREKLAAMEAEITRLNADNQRLGALEARLRKLETENQRLAGAAGAGQEAAPAAPITGAAGVETTPVPGGESVTSGNGGNGGNMFGEGNYAVHLASYRSREASVDGWRYLRGLYPKLLGDLSGHFSIFDVPSLGGRFYRLKAGPFNGAAGAQALCRSLNNAGEYCVVTVFDGEPLAN